MKHALAILAAVFSITATAAPVPQATHLWTTNKINEIVGTNTAAKIASATSATLTAAKDYTDEAIRGVGGLTPEAATNAAEAVVQRDVPNWARQPNPPAVTETDPTVHDWAKAENPPESMTDNAVVLTNNALKTKGGSAVTAANVGAVATNAYWTVKKGSEAGVGVRQAASGIGSTLFVGYNSFGTIDQGGHWQYSNGGYEDFFSGSVLRMLTGSQLWWLTGAKPWLQTPENFKVGGSSYNGGTALPTWVDGRADNRITENVPSWARSANKPTYTAAEVTGAQTAGDVATAIGNAGHLTSAQADAAYYPKAQGDAWSSYWDGDDVRVTVTNYDSVANIPSLYLEQRTNQTAQATNAFKIVWREMAHWERFLGTNWNWNAQWDGFKTWAANIAAQIAQKADKAWGYFDSHTGNYAPDGYTSISSANVMLCKDASYQKTLTTAGEVWVLTANDPYEPTGVSTNGGFQIKDHEGNVQFEIVKGDKVTVKAQANAVTVENGTTLVVTYNIIAGSHPTGEVCLDLANPTWKAETAADCPATVVWSGTSGNYVARITPTGAAATKCFFKATYQRGGDTYINNRCAVGMSQIVLNGTTYNLGTATISGSTVLTLTPAN